VALSKSARHIVIGDVDDQTHDSKDLLNTMRCHIHSCYLDSVTCHALTQFEI
jgi:hypothetical protein